MKPYYERDGIVIYCGDCLDVMPTLELEYDAIIADLPYNCTDLKWDKHISTNRLWENFNSIKKDQSPVVLFGKEPFSSLLVVSNLSDYRHKWIWQKDKSANFLHAQYMPIANCEDVLVFNKEGYTTSNKNKPIYNPQMSRVRTLKRPNTSNSLNEYSLRLIRGGEKPTPLFSKSNYDGYSRYPKMNLYFSVDYGKNRQHPTQKPVDLLAYLILTYTNQGDIILDNTMGSGTTLVAAQREGRRATGIEISEEYCKIAVERLRQPSFFSLPCKKEVPKAEQASLLENAE